MTAASNSEARKRAGAVASTCEHFYAWVSPAGSRHGVPICTSCAHPDPRWLNETMDQAAGAQIPPLSQPIPAPVASGAIGRLGEALSIVDRHRIHEAAWQTYNGGTDLLGDVVESIVREHTDRALAEVAQRIEHGPHRLGHNVSVVCSCVRCEATHACLAIVRAARQERGR